MPAFRGPENVTCQYLLQSPLLNFDRLGLEGTELWENAVYPPTYRCSFVSDCVTALQRENPHSPSIPTSIPGLLRKIGGDFLKEGTILSKCEILNACQCAGTCPDKPPSHEPPESDSERRRREVREREELRKILEELEIKREADEACRAPQPEYAGPPIKSELWPVPNTRR